MDRRLFLSLAAACAAWPSIAHAVSRPPIALRRLRLVNAHTGETFEGAYRNDKGPIERVIDELCIFLRDHHSGEKTRIDVGVVDFLADMLDAFKAFEPWRDAVLEQAASEQHRLGRKIAMEEDWLRYGVTARRTRNQRRLAELHALRSKRKEHRAAQGSVRLEAAHAELSGRLVAVAQGISKSYGGRPVVRDFSARIMRGDRVGVVGPNGPARQHCSTCSPAH
jgi:hypothetical protein